MKRTLFFWMFIFLISCMDNKKRVTTDHQQNENVYEVRNNKFLNEELNKVVNEYVSFYPLIKNEELPTKQSYYIGFSRFGQDTLLTIGRQPFLFELFPDFAFDNKFPIAPVVAKGVFYYKKDLPLIIFDEVNPLGDSFYDSSLLNETISEHFKIKDEFDTLIPPLWKYNVRDGQLKLIEKRDSLIIK